MLTLLTRKTRWTLIALSSAAATLVYACGPFFPLQLLDNREGTLLGTPSNSFAYEAARLVQVKPDDPLKRPAPAPTGMNNIGNEQFKKKIMEADLSASQSATLERMSKASDGDAAYEQGAGLPEAQRLYAAAVVDLAKAKQISESAFKAPVDEQGATTREAFAQLSHARHLTILAAARLETILKLPAKDNALALLAASRLARIVADDDLSPSPISDCDTGIPDCHFYEKRKAALSVYASLRAIAAQGAPDPFALAVASFGDQALLYLRNPATGQQCNWLSFLNSTPCAQGIPTDDLKQAIALYAQQAARGSQTGLESLQFIAAWALADSKRAAALIDDPIAQRLLVSYALASNSDSIATVANNADSTSQRLVVGDPATVNPNPDPNPALATLADAIQARHLSHLNQADLLASLAYKTGRYDLAATLIAGQDTALANWVRAKLALRRGDMNAAAQAYAQASKAFPTTDASVASTGATLIEGERGVLALARGQYVESLDLLYRAAQSAQNAPIDDGGGLGIGYANDAAYVAERVLTTDELKNFVDTRAPATPAPTLPAAKDGDFPAIPPTPEADTLRYLLARRLVRDGRVLEALPYFPVDGDPRFASTSYDEQSKKWVQTPTPYRQWAQEYAQALDTAQHAWFKAKRAQGWFRAATLAKTQGMELMGYEQAPDFANVDGGYDGGSGRDIYDYGGDGADAPGTPAKRAQAALKGPYITGEEIQRYTASESKPYERYHYRGIAAQYAQSAADLLPPRSQAYAAVLCQAARWDNYNNPDRAQGFYQEYAKRGAYVDFGGPFGTTCEAPDFRAAQYWPWTWTVMYVHHHVRRVAVIGGLVLIVLLAGAGVWYRRRRTKKLTQASV